MADFVVAGVAGFIAGLAMAGALWVAVTARATAVQAVAALLHRAEDRDRLPLSEPASQRSLRRTLAVANQLLTLDIVLISVALTVLVSYAAAPIAKNWWVFVGLAVAGAVSTRLAAFVSRRGAERPSVAGIYA